jgi:hypothetical protein
MVAAIRQNVTVQPGGLIEVRSPELMPGARAEVIVLLERSAAEQAPRDRATADQANASGGPPTTGDKSGEAWERLRRHAGAIRGDAPNGSANEAIDRDLAREYGDNHEDTAG